MSRRILMGYEMTNCDWTPAFKSISSEDLNDIRRNKISLITVECVEDSPADTATDFRLRRIIVDGKNYLCVGVETFATIKARKEARTMRYRKGDRIGMALRAI